MKNEERIAQLETENAQLEAKIAQLESENAKLKLLNDCYLEQLRLAAHRRFGRSRD
jgi:predicted nuclease with TOPRIM domain